MVRFIEAGANAKDCLQVPRVLISSTDRWFISILLWKKSSLVFSKPRRDRVQKFCHQLGPCQGLVQFSLCPIWLTSLFRAHSDWHCTAASKPILGSPWLPTLHGCWIHTWSDSWSPHLGPHSCRPIYPLWRENPAQEQMGKRIT